VRFRTLSQPIDTGTPIGRLLLHVLGAVAEFERALIAERTKRGMQHRKSQGATFGRAWKLSAEMRAEVADLVRQGARTVDIAARFGISRGSVRNYSKHVKRRRPRGRPLGK
jgi:DNA invertase Pin-like site-specific DNA recombinase